MDENTYEVNFDSLIGPTHNYSGLSVGNLASMEHEKQISNPKEAALQGLAKMHLLMSLGIKQAILPPQERPFIPILRKLGFEGTDEALLRQASQEAPEIYRACCSAAYMWAANAATVCPSADSQDQRVHFTPANLVSKFHRSFESPATGHLLKRIFANTHYFVHHDPLPSQANFADEGAANHTRFCRAYGELGIQLFVFGRSVSHSNLRVPSRFPARQTLEASQAIARLHQLDAKQTIFAQQNPEAIDQGVFHNDVISVGNQSLFFFHERAFANTQQVIDLLQDRMQEVCKIPLTLLKVTEKDIPLSEAVKTYLFNSQLISLPDQMVLIAPIECQHSTQVHAYLNSLLKHNGHSIKQVIYQDVRESMQNGGGPACLRLRVTLKEKEWKAIHSGVILTNNLYHWLVQWVNKYYRDRLAPGDLADPHLLLESQQALDVLSTHLGLGSIYSFQQ